MVGCLFLDRVLALHIQFRSHLVTVIYPEIFVQRLVIARYTATDTGCMGREDGSYLWLTVLQYKRSKACLPFVCMEDNLIFLTEIEFIETLYDKCRSISKHCRVVIIAVSMKTVNTIILPELTKQLTLLFKK